VYTATCDHDHDNHHNYNHDNEALISSGFGLTGIGFEIRAMIDMALIFICARLPRATTKMH
jgi:hypothetical protein